MKQGLLVVLAASVGLVPGCARQDGGWFAGDFSQAVSSAGERGTLVMLEFQTDWCSWCRRLEKDVFTRADVRQLLAGLVAVRLDAEGDDEELADRFGIDAYPTVVFVDADGDEIDRIVGYLPPREFVTEVERIKAGDTFAGCLARLREDPGDEDAIVRAVAGLLERADAEGAIARLEAFHASGDRHDDATCRRLMFQARAELQSRLYKRAGKLVANGGLARLDPPDTGGVRQLRALVDGMTGDEDVDRLAVDLNRARFADAGELLGQVDIEAADGAELYRIAEFAMSNGHYGLAGAVFSRWYGAAGDGADADTLNSVAWQLYLARRESDTATAIARRAWQSKQSAAIADTLARLLYEAGQREEAIRLQHRALELAATDEQPVYGEALDVMVAGERLADRPAFESFPRPSSANPPDQEVAAL